MVARVTRSCLDDSGEFFSVIFRITALIFQCPLVGSSKFSIDLLTPPKDQPILKLKSTCLWGPVYSTASLMPD